MYHRSLAAAALQTPRGPWRGRAGGAGAPQHPVMLDTPGARSDSGYDLEDSFLDDSQGAPFPCVLRDYGPHALCDQPHFSRLAEMLLSAPDKEQLPDASECASRCV